MIPTKRAERTRLTAVDTLWLTAGIVFAVFLMTTQAAALGGLGGLLLVGDDSALRPFIERFLSDVPLVDGKGHDGQIYFAIAHDLRGLEVPELINNPGIRYRRPVLPILSSLGGLISGSAVLWLGAAWIAGSFGLVVAAFRRLLARFGASPRLMVVPFVFPGFWLAIRLLTPDTIALALCLAALVLLLDGRFVFPIAAFTVAGLTKESFVVVPLAVGAWWFVSHRRWRALAVALIPTGAVIAYSWWILTRFDAPAVDGNIGLPFTGIWNAGDTWPLTAPSDRLLVWLTLATLAASVVSLFLARSALTRWLILPWPLLGIVSSEWIWEVGNGVARSFAPVTLFMALAIGERLSRQAGPRAFVDRVGSQADGDERDNPKTPSRRP